MKLTISSGGRADTALSAALPDMSRSAIQRLLKDGSVTKDGKAVRKNDLVSAGDTFDIEIPEARPADILPQEIPLDIVYEDQDIIVVNKPKGMVVHPAAGHPDHTLVNALLAHCGSSLSGIGGELRPGIVHRIDMDTSGLLIAAKNDMAHQSLASQLKDHTLSRTYWCIVCGNIREDSGTISAPIGRHPADRKRMAVTEHNSRPAVTHFRVLRRYRGYTLVECRLETGRTHQIRVHLAWQSHPILGDMVYGHKKPELGQTSQCLHAIALSFRHPRSGEYMELTCPLPEYFQNLLDGFTPLDSQRTPVLLPDTRQIVQKPGI